MNQIREEAMTQKQGKGNMKKIFVYRKKNTIKKHERPDEEKVRKVKRNQIK